MACEGPGSALGKRVLGPPTATPDIEATVEARVAEELAKAAEATVQAVLIACQSRIAFTSVRNGNFEIYVMNADGSDQTRLTNNDSWEGTPSWSPDMVAYGQ